MANKKEKHRDADSYWYSEKLGRLIHHPCAYPYPEPKKIVREPRPVEPVKNEPGTVEIKVVEDHNGFPVPNVKIEIKSPEGHQTLVRTDHHGIGQASNMTPGTCYLRSDIFHVTLDQFLEFVGEGDAPIHHQPHKMYAVVKPWPSELVIGKLIRHRVKTGETLLALTGKYGLLPGQIAYFNWGVTKPEEIQKCLKKYVGCTKKDARGNYIFDDLDDPGIIYIHENYWEPRNLGRIAYNDKRTFRVRTVDSGLGCVRIRILTSPAQAKALQERFRLFSADGSYDKTLTASDDLIDDDNFVDVLFTRVPTDLNYSFEIIIGEQSLEPMIQDVNFATLYHWAQQFTSQNEEADSPSDEKLFECEELTE